VELLTSFKIVLQIIEMIGLLYNIAYYIMIDGRGSLLTKNVRRRKMPVASLPYIYFDARD